MPGLSVSGFVVEVALIMAGLVGIGVVIGLLLRRR